MEEFVLTVIGDLEMSRRLLLKKLEEANARIAALEAELEEKQGQ